MGDLQKNNSQQPCAGRPGRTPPGNNEAFPFAVFLIFFFNLIIYPQWRLPEIQPVLKYFLAALYAAVSAGAYFFARRFARFAYLPRKGGGVSSGGDLKFMLIFGGLALLTHVPYFTLPLTTLGDAHMHAGLPALSRARAEAYFHSLAGFELRYLTVSAFILFLSLLWVFRERVKRAEYAFRAVCLLILAGGAYIAAVFYFAPFEKFGQLEHFLRYPLLGKLIYFVGYSVFGIYEWVGRASQLVFLLAGAVYFKRLLILISSRGAGRCGYAAFLMFPPFWNYGHHNYLEAGVLFFAVSSLYYLMLYLKSPGRNPLFMFVVFSSLAVVYKEYLLGILPISAALIIGFNFIERRLRKEEWLTLAAALSFPAVISAQYLLTFDYLRSLYSYYPQPVEAADIFSYQRLAASSGNIPAVIGAPLAVLSAAGFLAGLKKFRAGTCYMFIWFAVFWVLISASTGYAHPRTNLIFYIPLCAFICFLAGSLKRVREYFMPAAVFVLFSFVGLFMGPGDSVSTGETISLGKIGKNIYPYDSLFAYIKQEELYERRIYAPMICEPSHFYIAKHGILKTDFLDRRGWKERADNFEDFLRGGGFGYIVMPRGELTDEIFRRFMSEDLQADLLEGSFENIRLRAGFSSFGRNHLYLLEVSQTQ